MDEANEGRQKGKQKVYVSYNKYVLLNMNAEHMHKIADRLFDELKLSMLKPFHRAPKSLALSLKSRGTLLRVI